MHRDVTISAFTGYKQRLLPIMEQALRPPLDSRDFNSLATELFAIQFDFNRPYRSFCQNRGIKSPPVSDWQSIPAISTTAFKELDLTCLAPENRTRVFHSSGTTESSVSRHFHSAESMA